MISWVCFRTVSIKDAFHYTGILFGIGGKPANWLLVFDYFNTGLILTLVIAILGSTRFFDIIAAWFRKQYQETVMIKRILAVNVYELSSVLLVILILAFSVLFMVAGTNNPFIYFKF